MSTNPMMENLWLVFFSMWFATSATFMLTGEVRGPFGNLFEDLVFQIGAGWLYSIGYVLVWSLLAGAVEWFKEEFRADDN